MSYRLHILGFLCFCLHLGLILHHTYWTASQQNTRLFPRPESVPVTDRWHNFLDLNRWDSGHYRTIVLQGYRNSEAPDQPLHTIQWYPGYPLIAKAIHGVVGGNPYVIFSVLSALFTLGFWLLLWSPTMATVVGKKSLAWTSVLILSWPGGFYWFAGMTEPLVGLLILFSIHLLFCQKLNGVVAVLAYGTSVKQIFIPLVIAIFSWEWLRAKPKSVFFFLKIPVALAGFLAFGIYSWIHFNNFWASSDFTIQNYKKTISVLSWFDFNNYATYFWTRGGLITFSSLLFLLIIAVRAADRLPARKEWFSALKKTHSLPPEFLLWWLAFASTTFYVLGDAYTTHPFASIFRFQTTNIPLFLLLAWQFKNLRWWQGAVILFPLAWCFLFWQRQYTVQYWMWQWIA